MPVDRYDPGRHREEVYILTGAGSGIGAATAHRLAQEGARVVVSDVRLASAVTIAEEIEWAGGKAIAMACDVSSEEDVVAMVEGTVAHFGKVSGLFANAGTAARDGSTRRRSATGDACSA